MISFHPSDRTDYNAYIQIAQILKRAIAPPVPTPDPAPEPRVPLITPPAPEKSTSTDFATPNKPKPTSPSSPNKTKPASNEKATPKDQTNSPFPTYPSRPPQHSLPTPLYPYSTPTVSLKRHERTICPPHRRACHHSTNGQQTRLPYQTPPQSRCHHLGTLPCK